jgi:hypothetical protein
MDSRLPPLLLEAIPQRGGEWQLWIRLGDGRAGWLVVVDGWRDLVSVAELADAIEARLGPAASSAL